MADIIIEKIYKLPVFTWGAANLSSEGDARAAYLKAVKAADQGRLQFAPGLCPFLILTFIA
jgi:hypothetical protein